MRGEHYDVLVTDGGIVQLHNDVQAREIRELRADLRTAHRALLLCAAANGVLVAGIAVIAAVLA